MSAPVIYIAHSRNKHGFQCFSHERYPSERYGTTTASPHIVSDETLEAAQRELRDRIAYDWRGHASVPEIVDCGRVAAIVGYHHAYAPRVRP